MRWRDVRYEKPTSADGDEYGEVVAINDRGRKVAALWDSVKLPNYHFWCPMSELPDPPDRIPDPPEGWRFVVEGEAFDARAKVWVSDCKTWLPITSDGFSKRFTYIAPIDPPAPPEPQYRPFANAAEYAPYFGRMLKEKAIEDWRTIITSYSDKSVWLSGASIATSYSDAFGFLEFADGTPFGVKVAHAD